MWVDVKIKGIFFLWVNVMRGEISYNVGDKYEIDSDYLLVI